MTVPDKIMAYQEEFKGIFGVSLRNYMAFHGFNVVAFDEDVVRSGDNSMRNVVTEKWGERATALILELLEPVTPS